MAIEDEALEYMDKFEENVKETLQSIQKAREMLKKGDGVQCAEILMNAGQYHSGHTGYNFDFLYDMIETYYM